MENSHQKLSSKSIRKFGKDIWEFIVYRTKLYFLPLTIPFKLTNRKKEKMYFLMDCFKVTTYERFLARIQIQ